MYFSNLPLFLICLVAVISLGCPRMGSCYHAHGEDGYEELSNSFSPTNSSAVEGFSRFPTEKQVLVFLYAKFCRGDPRFRPMLIKNGEHKIPAITERIKVERMILAR